MSHFFCSRILLTLLIINLTILLSYSQNKDKKQKTEIKFEGAFAFTGTGDRLGLGIGTELKKIYKSGLSLAVGLSYFDFRYPNFLNEKSYYWSNAYSRYTASACEFSIYKSFGNWKLTPEIGVGIIGRHWFILDWYNYMDQFGYNNTSASIEEVNTLGYTGSIGFNYKLNYKSKLSLRGVLQNDRENNILWSSRIGYCRSF
jgi:hypothetical protein